MHIVGLRTLVFGGFSGMVPGIWGDRTRKGIERSGEKKKGSVGAIMVCSKSVQTRSRRPDTRILILKRDLPAATRPSWRAVGLTRSCFPAIALADAEASITSAWSGLYDVSPDFNPVLGRWPSLPGLSVAFGYDLIALFSVLPGTI